MLQQILLIYNLKAGPVKTRRSLNKLCLLFQAEGFLVECVSLEQFAGTVPFFADYCALVVAGGDGSIAPVIGHLLNEKIENPPPLAVLPWGTANDFCRQLYKKSCNAEGIIGLIKKGQVDRLDIGRVNDRYFINVVGKGLFCDVAFLTAGLFKRLLGRPAYYLHALVRLASYRSFKLTIEAGGELREEEVILFLVLNGSRVGGMFTPVPGASLTDKKLHFIAIKRKLPLSQLHSILKGLLHKQTLDLPGVIYFTAGKITLHDSTRLLPAVDGEPGPLAPLQITLLPARIPFFTA